MTCADQPAHPPNHPPTRHQAGARAPGGDAARGPRGGALRRAALGLRIAPRPRARKRAAPAARRGRAGQVTPMVTLTARRGAIDHCALSRIILSRISSFELVKYILLRTSGRTSARGQAKAGRSGR